MLPLAFAQTTGISGRIVDPQGYAISHAQVSLTQPNARTVEKSVTNEEGRFVFTNVPPGRYMLIVHAAGFEPREHAVTVSSSSTTSIDIGLKVAVKSQVVVVTADVRDGNVLSPDPAQRVLVRDEILDANPGRPGAPVSIPGLPIETASGGIKAPQYFAPGVAGDHGEPIAQYILVGNYLFPNNLSANAHGNGYSDPNILISSVIESVQTDGGAFNLREGNHSENLAVTYGMRSGLDPFLIMTGDYHDVDMVAGWSPTATSWITFEAAYGNGFLRRPEHRQQYKFNGFTSFNIGTHNLTLLGIGYYGSSYIPGLVPVNSKDPADTIDSRQKDQTHTGLIVVNDIWHVTSNQQVVLSGCFRTYNLALYSNFGDGLIRQSEFRTVTGSSVIYTNKIHELLTLLGGVDYQRDAPRHLDLDHYLSTDMASYGSFERVTANNVTINDIAPYIGIDGTVYKHFHYYMGFRQDEISLENRDLLIPGHSFSRWTGLNLPKATISFQPAAHSFLPAVAISAGQAFFTNDPRIGIGTVTQPNLVSRAHSYQLVATKTVKNTEFRLSLGHIKTEANLAKINADTGLQENEGPGRLKVITALTRHYFRNYMLEASFSQADARDLLTGSPTPEAPRMIIDILGTVNRLPLNFQIRSQFEYVRAKPLGDGLTGVPVKEFRLSVVRPFADGRMSMGMNLLLARGYTGQTTEVFAVPDQSVSPEQIVGVRIPSSLSLSCTYHFRSARAR